MEEFTPHTHLSWSFSSPMTCLTAAWGWDQRQLGGQVFLFGARVAAIYCLALCSLGINEFGSVQPCGQRVWVYLGHRPRGLPHLSEESSLHSVDRASDLVLLRNESKMARTALSGQPLDTPTSALPSGNPGAATISPKVCAQRFQLH